MPYISQAALTRIKHHLAEARKAATLENASFGFPNDRVFLHSIHGGDVPCTDLKTGDLRHPTEYVRQIVRLHHDTWILHPIDEALSLLESAQ